MSLELLADAVVTQTQPPTPDNDVLQFEKNLTPPIVVIGDYSKPIVVGRGGVDINIRQNKKISRKHLAIEYIKQTNSFGLRVLGMNGAYVDGEPHRNDEKTLVPLKEGALIEVRGTRLLFKFPEELNDIGEWSGEKTKEVVGNGKEKRNGWGDKYLNDFDLESDLSIPSIPSSFDSSPNTRTQQPPPRAKPTRSAASKKSSTTEKENQDSFLSSDDSSIPIRQYSTRHDSSNSFDSPSFQSPFKSEITDILIETFHFCGRPQLDIDEIYNEITGTYPQYRSQPEASFKSLLEKELKQQPFFIVRPKTPLLKKPTHWSYDGAKDTDEERRNRFAQIASSLPVRGARLGEKRYYFKTPQLRKSSRSSNGNSSQRSTSSTSSRKDSSISSSKSKSIDWKLKSNKDNRSRKRKSPEKEEKDNELEDSDIQGMQRRRIDSNEPQSTQEIREDVRRRKDMIAIGSD